MKGAVAPVRIMLTLWCQRFKPGRKMKAAIAAVLALALWQGTANAETPEEWVQLGTRVHGFFGGFVPAGIRIGLDARERLKADPRGLIVVYYQGVKAPCPCIVDGIMLATQSSPGQDTLKVADEKAPAGALAVIIIRHRKTGEGLRYTVGDDWLPKMLAWNQLEPLKRFEAAMKADQLFSVEPDALK